MWYPAPRGAIPGADADGARMNCALLASRSPFCMEPSLTCPCPALLAAACAQACDPNSDWPEPALEGEKLAQVGGCMGAWVYVGKLILRVTSFH